MFVSCGREIEGVSWKEMIRKVPPKKWISLVVIGIMFLIAAAYMEKGASEREEKTNVGEKERDLDGTDSYGTKMELRLAQILSTVEGAGRVEVILTFLDSGEKILNKDVDTSHSQMTEQDSAGGSRVSEETSYQEDTILSGDSYGSGSPYVIQEMTPSVAGILVVSDGGDSPIVVEKITDALSALFDLSPHKIKVLKRETNKPDM